MAADGFSPRLTEEELRRLLSARCDGWIDDDDMSRLESALQESREARQAYFQFMTVHAGVQAEIAARNYLETVPPALGESPTRQEAPDTESAGSGNRWLRRQPLWALAAGVAAAAALLVWTSRTAPSDGPNGNALAHIIDESPQSSWSLDHDSRPPDNAIRSGDLIRVSRGVVKLKFVRGSVLTLHGPALFEVISDMKGRALLGKLTAKIAEGSEGYSVVTPRATVIDLGTELGIEVDDAGATDIVVFEGAVDLSYNPQQGTSSRQRRLTTGEAMHLDAWGTISRIVSITNQRFSDDASANDESPQARAVISSVRDNIQRETAWNYYEIVRGGMAEDAKAFVDRVAHEWNGVDERGMPSYLLGGDYVKMFNNDKCRRDIEVVVTLNDPCRLYILFDDRIPAPQWLRTTFRDTGDDIGVDVGPWIYNGVPSVGAEPGVGPGISVDNVLSIWTRTIDKPGPVRLGSTETPHDDLNMYGIVAVPIARDSDAVK
jgi:hypothetical protein